MTLPVPQLAWLFHSKSVGGLWATPASADHTWEEKSHRQDQKQFKENPQMFINPFKSMYPHQSEQKQMKKIHTHKKTPL